MLSIVPLRICAFPYPPQHPLAGRAGVVYAFAVRDGGGFGLYDTGFARGHAWIDEVFDPRCADIRSALREHGLDPAAVRWIAHSHLHFDHCGQDHVLPHVPIYVQRAELEAARAAGYTIPGWAFFDGARHVALDGDRELEPGVRLLATPGHTAGHQSLAVDTAGGLAVLAGHAIFSAAEYDGSAPVTERSGLAAASAERLRALDPAVVHFSHDDAVWRRTMERIPR